MDDTLQQLFGEMFLENTRLLVKGVENFHLGYQRRLLRIKSSDPDRKEDHWQLGKLQSFVVEEYRQSIMNGNYLAQNPHTELFRFRRASPDIDWMEKEDSPPAERNDLALPPTSDIGNSSRRQVGRGLRDPV